MPRRVSGVAILAMLCLLIVCTTSLLPENASAVGPSKVVVLGFDGADANLVRTWMDQGKLPNLARLRDQGTFSPLWATNPPQTPVSWSTFATGMDPGKTEIFDFLKRDPDTYIHDFAMMTPTKEPFLFGTRNPPILAGILSVIVLAFLWGIVGRLSRRPLAGFIVGLVAAAILFFPTRGFLAENFPSRKPTAINNRKGTPFWQVLAKSGIHSTVIRVPQTFPPDDNPGGRLLSGLGVPDIRGTFGTYT